MRIVYVCADAGIPVLGGKGASVHVRAVTTALVARGHSVVVACASPGAGNPRPPVDDIVVLAEDHERALVGLLQGWRADAVIERYSLSSGPARRATARLGLPLILEVNAPLVLEAARYRGLTGVERWLALEREVFASADAIGAVSRPLVEYIARTAPGANAAWVPNGVDASRYAEAEPSDLGLPAGAVAIGFVGSMKRWHGTRALVDAVADLGPGSCAHVVLAGDGPEAPAIRRRITRRRLGDRVRWLGQLPHHRIPSLLSALDIGAAPYVAARDFYFSPLKVLEYLAAGLPVVCPALGDLPALVGDGGCAYSPAHADGLTLALQRLVEDPERRRATALASRARAAMWSWDANAAAYERLVTDGAAHAEGSAPAACLFGGEK